MTVVHGAQVVAEPKKRNRTLLVVDGTTRKSRAYASLSTTTHVLTFTRDGNGNLPVVLNIRRLVDAGLRLSTDAVGEVADSASYESIPLNADDATDPKWWSEPIAGVTTVWLRTESGSGKTLVYSLEYP